MPRSKQTEQAVLYEKFVYHCEAMVPTERDRFGRTHLANDHECGQPAVSRFYHQDEEGDGYETYRCADHPETDPDYQEQPL